MTLFTNRIPTALELNNDLFADVLEIWLVNGFSKIFSLPRKNVSLKKS